jgi:hypothetical protein
MWPYRPMGKRCTQIMPGTINTPLFDNARTKMGVKPVAPPPAYPARVVADAIVHAAAHPVRDLVVGGSAKTLITVEKIAPRLVDALLRRVDYEIHDTGESKPADGGQPRRPDHYERQRGGHRRRRDATPQCLHLVGDASPVRTFARTLVRPATALLGRLGSETTSPALTVVRQASRPTKARSHWAVSRGS